MTNVWEIVLNIEKAFALPGGIYNFGSAGSLNSHKLFLNAANLMGLKEPEAWILPDDERFCDQPRNLTMDCSLAKGYGIRFNDSVTGIDRALNSPLIRF